MASSTTVLSSTLLIENNVIPSHVASVGSCNMEQMEAYETELEFMKTQYAKDQEELEECQRNINSIQEMIESPQSEELYSINTDIESPPFFDNQIHARIAGKKKKILDLEEKMQERRKEEEIWTTRLRKVQEKRHNTNLMSFESSKQDEVCFLNENVVNNELQIQMLILTREATAESKEIVENEAKEVPEDEICLQNAPRKKKENRLSVHDRAMIDFYRNASNDGPTLQEELAGLYENMPNSKKESSQEVEEGEQSLETCTGTSEHDLWDVLTGNRANPSDIECPFVTEASLSFTSLFGEDPLEMDALDSFEIVDDSNSTIPLLKEESSMPNAEKEHRMTIFDFFPSSSSLWSAKIVIAGCLLVAAFSTAKIFRKT